MIYTREFFENKGWEFGYYADGILKFSKGGPDYKDDGLSAFIHANVNTQTIKITTSDIGYDDDGTPHVSVKYEGPCDTEEQFDEICNQIPLKV